MIECVINISEGRKLDAIDEIKKAIGSDVLDIHSDFHHHRSVFTLAGTSAARRLAELGSQRFDLREHVGVHPRIGIIDVVPFVPLEMSTFEQAIDARNEFAEFAASELGIPSFVYGPERDLPEIRKRAFIDLSLTLDRKLLTQLLARSVSERDKFWSPITSGSRTRPSKMAEESPEKFAVHKCARWVCN